MTGNLPKRWFRAIEDGTKTVEGRKEGSKSWQQGDRVVLSCGEMSLTVEITYVRVYPTIRAMVAAEGEAALTPGEDSRRCESIYREIYGLAENEDVRMVAYGVRLC